MCVCVCVCETGRRSGFSATTVPGLMLPCIKITSIFLELHIEGYTNIQYTHLGSTPEKYFT